MNLSVVDKDTLDKLLIEHGIPVHDDSFLGVLMKSLWPLDSEKKEERCTKCNGTGKVPYLDSELLCDRCYCTGKEPRKEEFVPNSAETLVVHQLKDKLAIATEALEKIAETHGWNSPQDKRDIARTALSQLKEEELRCPHYLTSICDDCESQQKPQAICKESLQVPVIRKNLTTEPQECEYEMRCEKDDCCGMGTYTDDGIKVCFKCLKPLDVKPTERTVMECEHDWTYVHPFCEKCKSSLVDRWYSKQEVKEMLEGLKVEEIIPQNKYEYGVSAEIFRMNRKIDTLLKNL